MKEVVRYSEAYKRGMAGKIERGEYRSLAEAKRKNGVRGKETIERRVKKYGREDLPPKRERAVQPRLGGWKLLYMLRGQLREDGIKAGRDKFFDILRKNGLLLEPLPSVTPKRIHGTVWRYIGIS